MNKFINESLTFFYNERKVRTVIKNGEPWFVLKDVCEIIGLSSPHKVVERLDEDERNQIPLTDNLDRRQNTTVVSEAGLYKVILRSDKPEADRLMRFITHEVLPSIRKFGAYITPEKLSELENNPDALPQHQLNQKAA
jgi:prophage antirepressor-like protein